MERECCEQTRCEYLIGTGQPKPVEDRYEHMSRDEQTQEIGAAQEPVLCSKCIHFRWSAQDGHR